jgi:hypothetical protein
MTEPASYQRRECVHFVLDLSGEGQAKITVEDECILACRIARFQSRKLFKHLAALSYLRSLLVEAASAPFCGASCGQR